MTKYIISPEAKNSLVDISEYTLNHHGDRQRKLYLRSIRDKIRTVARNPSIGIKRDEIKAGYYSTPVGNHTIYYRIKNNHIEIINVLHQSMEPRIHIK